MGGEVQRGAGGTYRAAERPWRARRGSRRDSCASGVRGGDEAARWGRLVSGGDARAALAGGARPGRGFVGPSCVREQAGVALQRGLASGVGKSWAAGKEGWAVRVAGPAGKERRGSGLGRVRWKGLGCWVLGLVLVFYFSGFSLLFFFKHHSTN